MATILILDGPDGTGKSTLATVLAAKLDALKLSFPNGKIREQLLDPGYKSSGPLGDATLFLHNFAVTMERLSQNPPKNEYIVFDRYWMSTVAYQHYAAGGDQQTLQYISSAATCLLKDHDVRMYLLMGTPDVDGSDRFEQQDSAFHERVVHGFSELTVYCEAVIEAKSAPPDQLAQQIIDAL